MAGLTIPEAIKENLNLSSDAKLAFSECFSRLKKGEKPEVTLSGIGSAFQIDTPQLIDALRELSTEGYARLDEGVDRLEDMVAEQRMRLTVHIHAQTLPLFPTDETSVNLRRYPPAHKEEPGFDVAKVGRMIYRATVSFFMGEHALTIRARHGDLVEQTTLVDSKPFHKDAEAWAWFDGFVEEMRRNHAAGIVLAGAAGDDPHGAVVAHLVEHGWEPDEAREASEATIGEGDRDLRIAAALRWLSARRPPLALPAPGDVGEADPDCGLLLNAARLALAEGGVTVAALRREFGLSAHRSSEILARLEAEGIVGPRRGAAPRDVLMDAEGIERRLARAESVDAILVEDETSEPTPTDAFEDPFPAVARWAAEREEFSMGDLETEFGLNRQWCIVLLGRLQKTGVIDDMGKPRPHVLMTTDEVEAMLAREVDGGR